MVESSVLALVSEDRAAVEVNCTVVAAFVECLASNLSCEAALPWTGYSTIPLQLPENVLFFFNIYFRRLPDSIFKLCGRVPMDE